MFVFFLLCDWLLDVRYMVEFVLGQCLFMEQFDDWMFDGGCQVDFEELGVFLVLCIVVVLFGYDEDDFYCFVVDVGLNEVFYVIGWIVWFDIVFQGVDKGMVLEQVCIEFGFVLECIFVVGDGCNDIGMFGWVFFFGGCVVVMGQVFFEVKDVVGEVIVDVVDGGFVQVLDMFLVFVQVSMGEQNLVRFMFG